LKNCKNDHALRGVLALWNGKHSASHPKKWITDGKLRLDLAQTSSS
jgi:hypothetical protein